MFTPIPGSKATATHARPALRHSMRRVSKLAMSGGLALALTASLAPAASADDHDHHSRHHDDDHGCTPRTFFKRDHLSPRNFFLPRTHYIDGPGGSMTVSVTREHEVLAFLETEKDRIHSTTTGDATITPGLVVRSLRKLGLPHLEERHMVFTGHEFTREVSKGMYGNMWYRVFGYRIGWSAWSVLGTCRHVKIASGFANVPARVEGWHYWESRHPTYKGRKLSFK
jgi:hypothetical protein